MMKKTIIITLFAASAMLSQGAAIHTGLINYWALDGNGDDTAGSFAEGASTVADNVAPGGTASAATIDVSGGLFGGSGVFQRGTGTDGRLAAADSADVGFIGSSLTISLWVQFENDDTGWQAMISRGEGSNYRIAVENNGGETSNWSPGYAGGTGDIFTQPGVNVQNGDWHHIVATTTHAGGTQLYVNGVLDATGVGPANINGTNPNANELWIGNNPGSAARMWDGRIDDVAQWGRVLSAAEVSEIYNAGLNGTALGGIGAVPEPSTGLLGVLAGLLLVARRRR